MKKLLAQLVKFGLVGALSFVIDTIITIFVSAIVRRMGVAFDDAAVIGGFFGFVVSVIVNYILSMKYVFIRKENMDRRKEFVIFIVLSVIGLIINEILLKLLAGGCEKILPQLVIDYPNLVTTGAKVLATGVVMVYNFITRKIFLEGKEEGNK